MFRRRRDWFQHELDVHRNYWECPRDCSELLFNTNDFESHMLDLHKSQLTQEQIGYLTKALSKQQDGRHKTNCRLCGEEYLVNESLCRHLGGEMEEIALSVMPRPHDFWDGSEGSSDTDTSESTDGLVEEDTSEKSKKKVEANTASLVDTTSKEAVSAANLSPGLLQEQAADLATSLLGVDDAHDSPHESGSFLSDARKEKREDFPIKDALETEFPDSESAFWIPEDPSDVNFDGSFQVGSNNADAGFDSGLPVGSLKNTIRAPAMVELGNSSSRLLGDSVPQELNFVMNPENSSQVDRNDVEWLTPIKISVQPTGVDAKSPETTYRTEYEENFATEFDQYHRGKFAVSDAGSDEAPEDTSPYYQGLNIPSGHAQALTENDGPISNNLREDSVPSPFLGVHSPVARPQTPPSLHVALQQMKSPPGSIYFPRGLPPSEGSGNPEEFDLTRYIPYQMGILSPPSVLATPTFICTHPGCTAAPFQTQYLLNSHANVHGPNRPHFCTVKGCPRALGGKGFKRKNEMIRHQLVHDSPGYICPFCADQQHKYPRPDNLQRCFFRFAKIDGSHADTSQTRSCPPP
jgi:hypothetical protein